jgi:hypothetical protein
MTTGALLFAYNNEEFDYVALAAWAARRITKHLEIPVCVVTDQPDSRLDHVQEVIIAAKAEPGTRYFSDVDRTVTWHNTNRMSVYELSPWHRTLVLDADYVVASSQLRCVIDSDQEFLCHRRAYDVTGLSTFDDLNCFGRHRMPMWWATVMCFDKTPRNEMLFSIMKMIRDNWKHYRDIYSVGRSTYRNDFSLSIALNIMEGHCLENSDIPWDLASVVPGHSIQQLDQDAFVIEFADSDKRRRRIELNQQDFHAMAKQQLGDIVASNT